MIVQQAAQAVELDRYSVHRTALAPLIAPVQAVVEVLISKRKRIDLAYEGCFIYPFLFLEKSILN